jgi:hypothetical protein
MTIISTKRSTLQKRAFLCFDLNLRTNKSEEPPQPRILESQIFATFAVLEIKQIATSQYILLYPNGVKNHRNVPYYILQTLTKQVV